MPRSSREESAATGRRIREVARRLFAAEGYAAVGLERVASEAGVTRGAVYHHHASKSDLFGAVLEDVQTEIASAVLAAAPGDGWEAVEAGALAFVRTATRADIRRILLLDGPAVLGWQEWRRIDREHGGRLLDEGLRALPDLAIDPDAAAALLDGAMNELAMWLAAGGDPHAGEAGLRRIIRSLRR